jgi:tetratricopeptide (TPR) repeat protein
MNLPAFPCFLIAAFSTACMTQAASLDEYNRASLLAGNGQLSEAIAAAKDLIQANPAHDRAWYLLASSSLQRRTPEDAAAFFRQWAAAHPNQPWPYYGLGTLAQLQNQTTAADHFRKCIALDAEALPCYQGLGYTARRIIPGHSRLGNLLALAQYHLSGHRIEAGLAAARDGAALSHKMGQVESEARFHELLGNLLAGRNRDYAESIPEFELARDTRISQGDWEGEMQNGLSILAEHVSSQNLPKAREWINKLTSQTTPPSTLSLQIAITEALARIQLKTGNPDSALDLLLKQKTLQQQASQRVDQLLLKIAALYSQRGDFESALAAARQSLATGPRDVDRAYALRSLGVLYSDHGDYSQALSFGLQSVKLFRKIAMHVQAGAGLRNLAEVHIILGNYAEADRLLQLALQSSRLGNDAGEQQGCLSTLGMLAARRGRPLASLVYLKRSLEIAKQTNYDAARVEALLGMAEAYARVGEMPLSLSHAKQGFEAATSLASPPLEAEAALQLAQIRFRNGDSAAAATGFTAVLASSKRLSSPELFVAA